MDLLTHDAKLAMVVLTFLATVRRLFETDKVDDSSSLRLRWEDIAAAFFHLADANGNGEWCLREFTTAADALAATIGARFARYSVATERILPDRVALARLRQVTGRAWRRLVR